MTAILKLDDWLDVVRREYLSDYVPNGGAAVKFVVPCDGSVTESIAGRVATSASEHGYVVSTVSAATIRLHMIDKVFNAIASQIPWADLAGRRLLDLCVGSFDTPATLSEGPADSQIAQHSGADIEYVRAVVNKQIGDHVFRDHTLARDFRIAMTWMCRARLTGGQEGETQFRDLIGWLSGETRTISGMKSYQIYTKINRANARHHFESLFAWVRRCGRPGTVVVLDAGRLADSKPRHDGTISYTKNALLDAYEAFRQFIDGTDDLQSAFIVVAADYAFLETEPGSRGLGAYPALMNRVYDEVHDRNLPNPMSSLLRVTTEAAR